MDKSMLETSGVKGEKFHFCLSHCFSETGITISIFLKKYNTL